MLFLRLRSVTLLAVLLFSLAVPATVEAQPAFLVKDLNTTIPPSPHQQITTLPSSIDPIRIEVSNLYRTQDFVVHDGKLLFVAQDDVLQDKALWLSDATAAGTTLVAYPEYTFALHELTPTAGGLTFFRTYTDLYKTDGTPEGTVSLSSGLPLPHELTALGSFVFYICADPPEAHGDLCRSDGTPEGTGLVKDIQPPSVFYQSSNLAPSPARNVVFFVADDGTSGRELFQSDGTEEGTTLVRDIWTGGDSSPNFLTDVRGTLFFSSFRPDVGRELWKSDGTLEGTVLVKDVRAGSDSAIETPSYQRTLLTVALGDRLLFVADDGIHGQELWISDGTTEGTVLVKDIAPGLGGADPDWLTALGDRIYFVADDAVHGRELWVSDGTEAGTSLVADVFPGEEDSLVHGLKAVGHVLLFSATDGVHGVEPWRSNGFLAGTRMVQDIAPAALSSYPTRFTPAGSHIFFAADDKVTGYEPWAMPRSAILATFADVPTSFWAWPFVEALAASGLTGGCGGDAYCPAGLVTRAQTAVFLVRGTHGLAFTPPPATGTVFGDVPAGFWAAPWIEQLAADGLTTGCSTSPPRYCPDDNLTRAEMAVLLLKAKHGSSYTPPPATGTVFTDVPVGFWAAPWIEQLAAEGITGGCGGGYCPGDAVNRAEMAVFLTRTFGLTLP